MAKTSLKAGLGPRCPFIIAQNINANKRSDDDFAKTAGEDEAKKRRHDHQERSGKFFSASALFQKEKSPENEKTKAGLCKIREKSVRRAVGGRAVCRAD